MKRFLLSLLVSLMFVAAGAQNRQLVLSHEGVPTLFALTEMDKALETAVANDTIFLPECNIPGFKITKPITIMGCGRSSVISENVEIELQDESADVKNALLDGVYVWDKVIFGNCTTPGTYHIRFCRMNGLFAGAPENLASNKESYASGVKNKMPKLVVESCYVGSTTQYSSSVGIHLGPGTGAAFIFNSCLENVWGSSLEGTVNYEYCNIMGFPNYSGRTADDNNYYLGYGRLNASFNKCLISSVSTLANSGIKVYNSCIAKFSLPVTSITKLNTIYASSSEDPLFDGDLDEYTYTLYGEVIGALGGTSPYSEYPSLPIITQSKAEMDADNRLVKISLNIAGVAPVQPETPENPEDPETPTE